MTRQSWLAQQSWDCHDCGTPLDSHTAYYVLGEPGFYCFAHYQDRAGEVT